LFDINAKKDRQRLDHMRRMTPIERLRLTLDLMDLGRTLSTDKCLPANPDDGIEWIVLKPKKPMESGWKIRSAIH
jgi:hypothetical protein